MMRPRPLADQTRFENIDRAARKVDCPKCHQPPHALCCTVNGNPTWECHRDRYETARARGLLPTVAPPVLTPPDRALIYRAGHRSTRAKGFVI